MRSPLSNDPQTDGSGSKTESAVDSGHSAVESSTVVPGTSGDVLRNAGAAAIVQDLLRDPLGQAHLLVVSGSLTLMV